MNPNPTQPIGDAAPFAAPPHLDVRTPRVFMPAGACDSHAHVCGPLDRYPAFAERIYSPPPEATLDNYRAMLAALGVSRAVLVQPSFYADDNSAVLDGLDAMGPQARGIVVLGDDVDDAELERMSAAGVRGVRFNIVDVKDGKGVLPMDRLRAVARRIAPLGWHIELLMHVNEFPDMDRAFADFPTEIVVGHLGYVPARHGTADPGFQALLRLMRDGRAWAKLTGPYRISATGLPHDDILPFAETLVDQVPDQLVWGSDWPHVKVSWSIPMPNDGDIADLLTRWVPDPAVRERVLVDNPARLYGFS
ncbi:amidohydrolase family protein [Aquabacter spiritensis]|uniref:Putative TIM-barrel fold metal-dependent hydrolase n=1 Tax=Aquabacter spiritensis TaxID=933073 RepID=A0A4R3LST3_9HYPH|nr:amidohydrolase family protein [Aquabacter spiritensis]TCT03580.1 putative TIM-barrel fold metal-dependent hydrolase [Aquabacter spiritensis]